MLRLADADSYRLRAKELQARWLRRALHAQEHKSMVKHWLLDAINDMSSPTRLLMTKNPVWDLMYNIAKLNNKPLAALWTKQNTDRANIMRQRTFIGYDIDNPFEDARHVKHPDEIRTQVRQEWWHNGKLVRDLPPITGSPLKHLFLPKEHRRQLLSWWLGSLPGHKRSQTCHISQEEMAIHARRAHAARCVETLGLLLPPIEFFETNYNGTDTHALQRKASNDNITNAIWLMYSHQQWDPDEGWAAIVFQALQAVVSRCLRYTFG